MRRNSLVLKVIPLLFLEDTRRVKSHQTMKLPEINLNDIFLCLFLGRARLLSQKGIANGRLSEKRVGIFLPLPKSHARFTRALAAACIGVGLLLSGLRHQLLLLLDQHTGNRKGDCPRAGALYRSSLLPLGCIGVAVVQTWPRRLKD